ncbi:hypothetical protein [Pseudoxanthomonas sp.]|uniref:hypothetical protein n=1 Tax=Pseudoxanthomonas sp. TaxID=1871049 RepID=UPI0025839012|nr:hypothetical protein [Pseudoxanthomonas sp.]MCR6685410.1 hypothetical protein [Pseudoxanthomonas sp.]
MSVSRAAMGRLLAALAATAMPAAATAVTPVAADAAPLAVDAGTDAEPAPFLGGVLSQSRILYPLQVGPWTAVSEERYRQQEAGVSVRYADRRRQRWLDLFFYPLPVRGEQALAALAISEREGIAAGARQRGEDLDLGELAPLSLSIDGGALPAWELGMRYRDGNRSSAMLLFARELYVVKARASAMPGGLRKTAEDVDSLQRALRAFMQEVAARMRIASTGGCWLPARPVPALPPADSDEVLASRTGAGGAVLAVALRDRVLVDEAESARAAALAAELSAALYPGCVAPEAIEPEVPESLRELRIEYRAPDTVDTPSRGPPVGRPRVPLSGTG